MERRACKHNAKRTGISTIAKSNPLLVHCIPLRSCCLVRTEIGGTVDAEATRIVKRMVTV